MFQLANAQGIKTGSRKLISRCVTAQVALFVFSPCRIVCKGPMHWSDITAEWPFWKHLAAIWQPPCPVFAVVINEPNQCTLP